MSRSSMFIVSQVVGVIGLAGFAGVAGAVERHVPAGYANVQAAVDVAVDGDEVVLAPGTYTGPGNQDVTFQNKAVLIRSALPDDTATVAATIIRCQGTAASPHNFVTIDVDQPSQSTYGLAGLTITGAYADDGAIVCGPYSAPTIRRCVIRGNTGSGIYCDQSSHPTILNCTIQGNAAGQYGGGIQLVDQSDATIEGCIIRGNSAQYGGGIFSDSSWPEIDDTQITGNYSSVQGGGIYWLDSAVTLRNCTIACNAAQNGGGLFALSRIYNDASDIRNTIIWGNVAANGPQVQLEADPFWLDIDSLAVSYSLVQGGQAAITVPAGWTLDWQAGNLPGTTNPQFVSAVAPGSAGGVVAGDYHLAGTSACVDAGDPAISYAGMTDAAGQARVLGPQVDVGAYETTRSATLAGDVNSDGKVDMQDLHRLVLSWNKHKGQRGYDAASDLDGNGAVNILDLALLIRRLSSNA